MILQLSYSGINKKSSIFFMPFLSQKQKLCHQNSHSSSDCLFVDRVTRRSLGFWQNHMIFVLLKRNGPSLRTLAEPEAEVKVVKFCFKKKSFIQTNPTFAGQFVFQYLVTNYRRAQVQLGCSTRR